MGRARHFLPPAALYAVITVQSSFRLPGPPVPFQGGDKVAHVVAYGVVAFFLARALARGLAVSLGRWALVLWTTCVIGVLGLLDEIHQSFVPGRSSEAFDVVADLVGGILGASLWVVLAKLRGGVDESPAPGVPPDH